MRLTFASALAVLTISACATAPVPLTDLEFDAALSTAGGKWHPYVTIESLSETLETAVLTDEQRSELLFERGRTRRLQRIDVPAAVTDFDAAAALSTEPELLSNLEEEKAFALEDIEQIEARLGGLQNFSNWFADSVAMGRVSTVAERLRTSGLSPSEYEARMLEAAGYLCRGTGEDPSADFTLGETGHLKAMNWCDSEDEPAVEAVSVETAVEAEAPAEVNILVVEETAEPVEAAAETGETETPEVPDESDAAAEPEEAETPDEAPEASEAVSNPAEA